MIRASVAAFALLAAIASVFVACKDETKNPGKPPPPPVAPNLLAVIHTTATSIGLRWNDRSDNEAGFYVYDSLAGQPWQRVDTVAANRREDTLVGLQPSTQYWFRVSAFNSSGESEPSNTATASTRTPNLPPAPDGVTAEVRSAFVVRITWIDHGTCDNFIVQRREAVAGWTRVGAVPDNVTVWLDSSCRPQTLYFFRVGASDSRGVNWSPDSAAATTLPEGAPEPPESLRTEIVLGFGVVLTWNDVSLNETRFDIARGRQGQPPDSIDTVPANVGTYTDLLADSVDEYFYYVRSANGFGVSAWTAPVRANYRACSNGVMPVCLGNWWEYNVTDTVGPDYVMRRTVADTSYVEGLEYYLITQTRGGGLTDSLYYLRNTRAGCNYLRHPLPPSPIPELWFKYPARQAGDSLYVDGHLMVVTSVGTTRDVAGRRYYGVYGYQWWFSTVPPRHSIQFWVEPDSVGIVQEQEWFNEEEVARRELIRYFIQN